MFNNSYRVLVKTKGSKIFRGTGQTLEGDITIEPNVINQMFYSEENAIKLSESLIRSGMETKIVKGSLKEGINDDKKRY